MSTRPGDNTIYLSMGIALWWSISCEHLIRDHFLDIGPMLELHHRLLQEWWFQATFNRKELELFNFDVDALCRDGCLQEGTSTEAALLTDHLRLDNFRWTWDNNEIMDGGQYIRGHSGEIIDILGDLSEELKHSRMVHAELELPISATSGC